MSEVRRTPASIVLDSTVFGRVPRADGPLFVQLRDYVTRSGALLYIPTVVIKELERSLQANVRKDADTAARSLRRLSEAGALADSLPELSDRDTLAERAQKSLRDRLGELGSRRVEVPNVSHDDVIDRLHAGKKPFGGSGDRREDGYRDYLIWRTVLEVASQDQAKAVTFISNDKGAFGGSQATDLAPELLEDAERLQVHVHWRRDLWSFLDEYAKPWQQSVERLREAIASDAREGRLDEFLTENIPETPLWHFADPESIGLHPQLDDLSIVGLTEVRNIDVVDVLSLTGEMGAGRVRATVTLHLSQIVDADDPPVFDEDDGPAVALTRLSRREALAEIDVEATVVFDVGYAVTARGATPWGLEIAEIEF